MVYQEVIQEKLAEVSLLLAQNREQQVGLPMHADPPDPESLHSNAPRIEFWLVCSSPSHLPCLAPDGLQLTLFLSQEEILWDLAGSRGPRVKDSKSLPSNMYIGHFMKPYFKDKVTGVVSG